LLLYSFASPRAHWPRRLFLVTAKTDARLPHCKLLGSRIPRPCLSLGNGDGTTFENPIFYALPTPPIVVIPIITNKIVQNVNLDGKPDLVLRSGQLVLGNGDGSFTSAAPLSPTAWHPWASSCSGNCALESRLGIAVDLFFGFYNAGAEQLQRRWGKQWPENDARNLQLYGDGEFRQRADSVCLYSRCPITSASLLIEYRKPE
jgi:hypothetical protein